ncbi:hypothetical protein BGX27_005206 [Mortierella sp. AM989]|nr:hypothetical protein BGX27_005206 [Mortierella sp. AM989]
MSTKAMQRSFFLVLLALLCLSNVVVQAQVTSSQPTGSVTGTAPPASSGTATNSASGTGTASGTATGTASGTASGTAATPLPTRTPRDPVASLTMLNPKANFLNPPLFQIGVDIQFSWDYDKYLLLPPTNLTIEAFMTNNPTNIITIGAGLPGNIKNYTWVGSSQINATHPIQTGIYTLRIFDGAVGRSGSLPEGGYLITFAGLKFGLYITSPYLPGDQANPRVCATCDFAKVTNDALATLLPFVTMLLATAISTLMVLA